MDRRRQVRARRVVEQVDGDSVHISEGGSGFKNANGVVSIHSGVISAKSPGATFWYPDGNTTAASKPSDGISSSSQGSSATSTKWTCSASSSDDSDTGTVNVKYSGNGYHASPEDAKGIAKQMIASGYKEWDNDNDWQALVWIWQHESGWQWNATNPTSGAYGIPQSYPASKLAAAGSDWKDNAATQIKWGLQYTSNLTQSVSSNSLKNSISASSSFAPDHCFANVRSAQIVAKGLSSAGRPMLSGFSFPKYSIKL